MREGLREKGGMEGEGREEGRGRGREGGRREASHSAEKVEEGGGDLRVRPEGVEHQENRRLCTGGEKAPSLSGGGRTQHTQLGGTH